MPECRDIASGARCRTGVAPKMILQVAEDYPDADPRPDEADAVANRLLPAW